MIQNLKLYTVLNSSGSWALLVKLWTRTGVYQAKVPMSDDNPASIKKLRNMFSNIRPNLIGLNEEDWMSFDSFLSQFNAKRDLNNSLGLSLSLACARAATRNDLWKLKGTGNWFPYLMGTVALGKDWKEFMLIPYRENSISEAYAALKEAWRITGGELKQKGFLRGRSTSGAWLSDLSDIETLYFLNQIASDWNMRLGINIGATAFWDAKNKVYSYKSKGTIINKDLDSEEHTSLISAIAEQYNIWYIEDPFHSLDVMSHAYLGHKLEDVIIAGSDLYESDLDRIKSGSKLVSTKAVSVNPAHLSSLSQLMEIADYAKGRGMKITLSRFSKETEDSWLADIALAFGADMLKLGIMGADNTAKLSRLLEIWDDAPAPRMGLAGMKSEPSENQYDGP